MDKQEAMAKVQEFQDIINSSNRIFISSKQMLWIGIGLLLVPVVELMTDHFTFGFEISETVTSFLPGLKAVFYGLVFWGIGKLFPDKYLDKVNPLIRKTFGVQVPFVAAILAIGLGLGFTKNGELVYPTVFVLLGIFCNLLGRFSNKSLTLVSWLYIIAGPLFMYLLQFEIPNLWVYFMVFHSFTCIYIGLYTKRLEAE